MTELSSEPRGWFDARPKIVILGGSPRLQMLQEVRAVIPKHLMCRNNVKLIFRQGMVRFSMPLQTSPTPYFSMPQVHHYLFLPCFLTLPFVLSLLFYSCLCLHPSCVFGGFVFLCQPNEIEDLTKVSVLSARVVIVLGEARDPEISDCMVTSVVLAVQVTGLR